MGAAVALALLVAVTTPAGPACPAEAEIALDQAPRCIGQTRTVVARLDHVGRSRTGTTFLNFCADYRSCPFTAVVFAADAAAAEKLPLLAGSVVAVQGPIVQYRGQAEIVIRSASQVVRRSAPAPVPVPPPAEKLPESVPAPAAPQPAPQNAVESGAPVPAGRAAQHVGKAARLVGRIDRVVAQGGDVVAFFGAPGDELPFVAVVAEPAAARLGPVLRALSGRVVIVSGDVLLFDGRPCIYVHDASQLRPVEPGR